MPALAGIWLIRAVAVVTTEVFRRRGPSPAETCISQLILLSQVGFKLPSENYLPGGCTGV